MSNSETSGDAGSRLVPGAGGRVLVLSMRRLADLVAFCLQYEFEDVAAEVTGADRVEADGRSSLERWRRAYKAVRLTTRSRGLARALAPLPPTVRLEREYDLFLPVFNHAFELHALSAVPDWRKRCRTAACFVNEIWSDQIPGYLVELLAEFDHVFLGFRQPVAAVARLTGRPCSYLPYGADVVRFAPFPNPPGRPIDLCNIGRRSPVTHQALLRLASGGRPFFYYFDTVAASGAGFKQRTFRVDAPREHRLLLASLLRRSRFFIANRARVNEPEAIQGQDEIAARFFEGAAAGTVVLGEAPRTEEFRRLFDWPDAVIHLPFDSPDVGDILADLDRDPARLERIGRSNVRNAALRHDWLHRIQAIFDALGLPPTPAMAARAAQLRTIAEAAA